MAFRAVFFDLDDTLYPYPPCNEAGKRAAYETARERGYEFTRDEFEAFYQLGRRATKRELPGEAASHERFLYFEHALYEHTGTARPGDAHALGSAYWDGYVEAMELFEDVPATLRQLREAGLAVAILTNLTTHVQLRKLDALGLGDETDLLVTSEQVGREKPHAAMFTVPLAGLGLRADEVLMVGDDPGPDVEGANAVGIETALFNCEDPGFDGLREPDHRLDSFDEVLEVVL